MVAKPAVAAVCNAAATNAAPDGRTPFDVPLRVAGGNGTVAAYWCSWDMKVGEALALRNWMTNQGATTAETTVIQPGDTVPLTRRIYIFNGKENDGFTPDQVLTTLHLDRMATTT